MGYETSAIRPTSPWYLHQLCVLVFALIYGLVVLFSQPSMSYNDGDFPWYMNRAQFLYAGERDDGWIYTLTYPLGVGAVNLIVKDIATSAKLFNVGVVCSLFLGIYILGSRFFTPYISWVAIILIATNWVFIQYLLQMQTLILFGNLIIWALICAERLIRMPSLLRALVLAVILTATYYARFEGLLYLLLAPIIFVMVYRSKKVALSRLFIWLVCCCIVMFPFLLIFVYVASKGILLTQSFSMLSVLRSNPLGVLYLGREIATEFSYTLSFYPTVLWLLWLTGLVYGQLQNRKAVVCFSIITILHAVTLLFVTIAMTGTSYFSTILILGALPFSSGLFASVSVIPQLRRPILIILTGCFIYSSLYSLSLTLLDYSSPSQRAFAETQSQVEYAEEVLVAEGYSDGTLYTFCPQYIIFSHLETRLIYKYSAYFDNPDMYNSPKNVLPRAEQRGDLIMYCDNKFGFGDWDDYFAQAKPNYVLIPLDLDTAPFRFFTVRKQ